MARKKQHGGTRQGAGRPKSGRDDATARIDRAILGKAQMVAKARKTSVAEYLSSLLQNPVDRDFLKEMEKLKGSKS